MVNHLRTYWRYLRYLNPFPKRYKTPIGKTRRFWSKVAHDYANMQKVITCSDYHWRVIYYDDGRKELAYLRVLKGGIFSGRYHAIYRGLLIPRRLGFGTFAHVKSIKLAF